MRVGFKNKGGRGPIDPATGERIGAEQAAFNSMLARTSPEAGLSSIPNKVISPEDISEFRRLGVNPGLRTTMQEDYDRLAYSQKNTEVWTRGLTNFVGKTTMYTVGGIIGGFYGLGSAAVNMDMSKMWDNKFSNGMADAEEWMDDRFKIHMSSEVQEANFLKSLGASSFWARDVLGGLAFTAGAVLSELTIGAMTAGVGTALRATTIPAKVAKAVQWGRKIFKIGQKAEDALKATAKVDDAIKAAQGLSRIDNAANLLKDAGLVARRTLTGAGFESGVEAIHFRKEAMENWVKEYQEANSGQLPTNEEYMKMEEVISKTGNAIYGLNMVTVGLSNFATLGKIFRKGITSNQMVMKNASSFYGKQMPTKNIFGVPLGKAVGATKGTKTGERLFKSKYNTAFSALGYTAAAVKNPLVEGMFEEGLQGTYNKTGLDYIHSMYNEDAIFSMYDLFSHMGEGLEQTYTTKEGWKEIGIGMLIGALGVPGKRWQGGVVGEILDVKENIKTSRELAKRLNESQAKINIAAHHMAAMQQSAAEEDAAIEDGDIFRAKTAEDQQIFSTLAMRYETGFMKEYLEDFDEIIDNSSKEEFEQLFNYESLTEEEFQSRKDELKNSIRERSAAVEKAYNVSLSMVTPTDMNSEAQRNIQRAAAFMAYNIDRYGEREEEIAQEIIDKIGEGSGLSIKDLKNFWKLNKYAKQRSNWIQNYYLPAIQAAKDAKDPKEVERLTKKKDALREKLIADIKKSEAPQGVSKLEYKRDVDDFLSNQLDEVLDAAANIEAVLKDKAVEEFDIKAKIKDLQRVGYERQSFIDQIRLLRTDAGMEAASNDVLDMMAKSERFGKTMMGVITQMNGMQMIEEARKNNKTLSSRQLLMNLYNSMGGMLGTEISAAPKGETTVEQMMDLTRPKLGDPSELTELKKRIAALLENITTEDREGNIKRLEEIQKVLEEFRESPEFTSIKSSRDIELINEYIDQMIDMVAPAIEEQQKIAKEEKEEKAAEREHSGNKVFWRLKDLFKVMSKEQKMDLWDLVRGVSPKDLKTKIKFRRSEYVTEEREVSTNNDNVQIVRGIEDGDKYSKIEVLIDGKVVGGITFPSQFIINDAKIDFEKLATDLDYAKSILRELNSDWVDIGDPTVAVNALVALNDFEKGLRDKFENKNEIDFPSELINEDSFNNEGISYSIQPLKERIPFSEIEGEMKEGTKVKMTLNEDGEPDSSGTEYNNHIVIRTTVGPRGTRRLKGVYVSEIDDVKNFEQLSTEDPRFKFIMNNIMTSFENEASNLRRLNTPFLIITQAADNYGFLTAGMPDYNKSETFEEGVKRLIFDEALPALKEYMKNNRDRDLSSIEEGENIPDLPDNYFITATAKSGVSIYLRTSPDGSIFLSVNKGRENFTMNIPIEYDYDSDSFIFYPTPKSKKTKSGKYVGIRQELKKIRESYNNLEERQRAKIRLLKDYGNKTSKKSPAYGTAVSPELIVRQFLDDSVPYSVVNKTKAKFKLDEFELYRITASYSIVPNEEGKFDFSNIAPEADLRMAMFLPPKGQYIANIQEFDFDIWMSQREKQTKEKQKKKKEKKVDPEIDNLDEFLSQFTEDIQGFIDKGISTENIIRGLRDDIIDNYLKDFNDPVKAYSTIEDEVIKFVESFVEEKEEEVETEEDTQEPSDELKEYLEMQLNIKEDLEKLKQETTAAAKELNKKVANQEITKAEARKKLAEYTQKKKEANEALKNITEKIIKLQEKEFGSQASTLFKISRLPIKDRIDMELALQRLKKIIPQVPVDDLRNLAVNIKLKGFVQGAFSQGIVYLTENAEQGVEYHEAFHAVFRLLLSDQEIKRYLDFAKRHYKNPTSEEITAIAKASKVTRPEAVNIYYEEKMADDFQKYASGKKDRLPNLLQRLWERFLRWLGIINDTEVDRLFKSIYRGDFASRTVANNNTRGETVYSLRSGYKVGEKQTITKYLSDSISDSIVATIAATIGNKDDVSLNSVAYEMEMLAAKYEDMSLSYLLSDSSEEDIEKVQNRTEDIQNALTDPSNVEIVTKKVRDKLSFLQQYEEAEEDAGTEEDAQKESWQQNPNEIGGYGSASKRLRHYISLIVGPRNIYGVSKRDWENFVANNEDSVVHMSVDANLLYNQLIKMLAGTPKYRMLKQLSVLTDIDDNIKLFVNKAFADIAADLKVTPDEVANLPLSVLEKSNTFNFITSQLRKDRMYHYDITYATNTKQGILYNANSKSAGTTQIELWRAYADQKFGASFVDNADDLSDDFKTFLDSGYFSQDTMSARVLNAIKKNNFDELVDTVVNAFDAIGIDMNKHYVKYSLVKLVADKTAQASAPVRTQMRGLMEWFEAHQNVTGIWEDVDKLDSLTEGIDQAIKFGQFNLFSNVVRETSTDSEYVPGQINKEIGVLSSIRDIARANAVFNPVVIPSVFQNQEGKNQYDIIEANYLTETIGYFKDPNNIRLLESLIEQDIEIDEAARLIVQDEYFPGMFKSVEKAKRWLDTLYFNPLLRDDAGQFDSSVFNDEFNISIIGGIKAREVDEFGFTKTYGDQAKVKGATWKHAKPADKQLMLMAFFDTSEGSRTAHKIGNKEFVLFRTGVPSDASMVSLVRMEKKNYADEKGITQEASDAISLLIQQELSRIENTLQEVKDIKSGVKTTEISENFHYVTDKAGDKVFYDGTEFFTMVDGKPVKKYDNTVENFKEYGSRGLKFWNIKDLENSDDLVYEFISAENFEGLAEAVKETAASFMNRQADLFIDELIKLGIINIESEENLISQKEALKRKIKTRKTNNLPIDKLEDKLEIINEQLEHAKEKPLFKGGNITKGYVTEDNIVKIGEVKNYFFNDYINSWSYNNLMFGDNAFIAKNPIDWAKRLKGGNASGNDYGNGTTNVMTIRDQKFVLSDSKIKEIREGAKDPIERADGQTRTTVGWYRDTIIRSEGNLTSEVDRILKKVEMGYTITPAEGKVLADNQAETQPSKTVGFDPSHYIKTSVAPILRSEVSYTRDRNKLDSLYREIFKEKEKPNPSKTKIAGLYDQVHQLWSPIPGAEFLHDTLNKMEANDIGLAVYDSASKRNKEDITEIIYDKGVPKSVGDFVTYQISNKYLRNQVKTHGFKEKIIDGTQKLGLIWSEQDKNAIIHYMGKEINGTQAVSQYEKLLAKRVKDGIEYLKNVLLDGDKAQYNVLMSSFKKSAEASGISPVLMAYFETDAWGEPVHDLNNPAIEAKIEAMFLAFASADVLKHKTTGHKFSLISDHGYQVHRDKKGNVIPRREIVRKLQEGEELNTTIDRLHYQPGNINTMEVVVSERFLAAHGLSIGDTIPENILQMHGIRIPTQDKHSMGVFKIVDFMPMNMGNGIIVPPEITYLSGSDFDIDALYAKAVSFFKDGNNVIMYGDYARKDDINEALESAHKEYLNSAKKSKKVRDLVQMLEDDDRVSYKGVEMARVKALKAKINDLRDKQILNREEYDNLSPEEKLFVRDGKLFYNPGEIKSEKAKELKALRKEIEDIKDEFTMIALEILGFAYEQKDFNARYKKQIQENMKFYSGKNNSLVPITKEENDNYLLSLEKSLTMNNGNKDIATTPATRDLYKELAEQLFQIKEDPTVTIGAHSPLDKMLIDAATSIGQDNIGIAAVSNILVQRLFKEGIEIPGGIMGRSAFTLTSETGNRVNDNGSTTLTGMTDNQKYNDAGKFNLTGDTLSYATLMNMLGHDFKKVNAITSTNLFKSIVNEFDTTKRMINPELKNAKSIVSDAISDNLIGVKGIKLEDILKEMNESYSYEEILEYIKKEQGQETELSDRKFDLMTHAIGQSFLIAKQVQDELFQVREIIQLVKGISKNFDSARKKTEALDKLGYYISDGKIKQKEDAETILDIESLLNSEFIKEQLLAYDEIMHISKKFFILETDYARGILQDMNDLLGYVTDEDKTKIRRQALAYFAVTAFKHQNQQYSTIDFNELITDGTMSALQTSIIEALSRQPSNKLLRFLGFEYRDYRGEDYEDSFFADKVIALVKGNVRSIKDPAYLASLADGFNSLAISENPEDRKLAVDLIKYLMAKDSFLYNNDSFIQHINPNFLLSLSKAGKSVLEAFNGQRKFDSVFGMTASELRDDFNSLFSRWIANGSLFSMWNYKKAQDIIDEIEDTKVDKEDFSNASWLSYDDTSFKAPSKSPIHFSKIKRGDKWELLTAEKEGEEVSELVVAPFKKGRTKKNLKYLYRNFPLISSREDNKHAQFDMYGRIAFGGVYRNLVIDRIGNWYKVKGENVFVVHSLDGSYIKGDKVKWSDIKDQVASKINGNRVEAIRVVYNVRKYISSYDVMPYASGMKAFEEYMRANSQAVSFTKKGKGLATKKVEPTKNTKKKGDVKMIPVSQEYRSFNIVPEFLYDSYLPEDPADLTPEMIKDAYGGNPATTIHNLLAAHYFPGQNDTALELIASVINLGAIEVKNLKAIKVDKDERGIIKKDSRSKLVIGDQTEIILTKDKTGKYASYLDRLVKDDEFGLKQIQKLIDINQDFKPKRIKGDKQLLSNDQIVKIDKAEKILNQLSDKFNIAWEWNEDINALGMFSDGKVLINPNQFRRDTLFHEFAHPFIHVVKNTNPLLYKTLVEEIKNSDILIETQRIYSELSEQDQIEEAIVAAIGMSASKQMEGTKLGRLIKTLLKRIAQAISDIFGVKIDSLNPTLTIDELGLLMLSGDKIDLQLQSIDGFEEVC